MDLSIIIPVYNAEAYIEQCLDSCLKQGELINYEIIAINDGSTDKSLDILNKISKKESRITVFSQENKRQGAARNVGIRAAKGKYIWFVDADDWVEPFVAETCINTLQEYDLDVLRLDACNQPMGKDSIKRNCKHTPDVIYDNLSVFDENHFSVCVPFHFFKKDFILRNNLFFLERVLFEDNAFMIHLFMSEPRMLYQQIMIYNVRINENSSTRGHNPKRVYDMIHIIENIIENANKAQLYVRLQEKLGVRLGRLINSALWESKDAPSVFKEVSSKIRAIKDLDYFVPSSSNRLHQIQYKLLALPSALRLLMVLYYRIWNPVYN